LLISESNVLGSLRTPPLRRKSMMAATPAETKL